ncbi:glycosyltransferase family A protein [Streptomyces sp. NPDC048636]|uniref:glycosyltransferase family 2 protein n=1 Tax=Streptomyces sp. NPDC048636 TaxID=3155762 RepID=UPI003424A0D3
MPEQSGIPPMSERTRRDRDIISRRWRRVRYWTSQRTRPGANGEFDLDAQRARWTSDTPPPLVSCLMVTKDRPGFAARAVRCFLAQTHAPAELVVVDDGTDDTLARHLDALADPRIRHHRTPRPGLTLGEVRNLAVELAAGPYVCQWDDDDVYDPERLEVQLAAVAGLGASACFLARERLWWPARRTLALSGARVWENSMLCAREGMPRYPALRRGEDSAVALGVVRAGLVVSVDAPELYTYVCHGANTCDEPHLARLFEAAAQRWTGDGYEERTREMATRLPLTTADLPLPRPAP